MATKRSGYLDFADINRLRHEWMPVTIIGPKGITAELTAWLADYPGEFDLTTEPMIDHTRVTYKWWFSDDDTAFAFKMRWA